MTTTQNPFVGPRAFEKGEKIFGRDRELRALSALLIAERLVLLHSPSGAGKTSLLKAGLLPHLVEEEFNVLPVIRVNIEPPPEAGEANRYLISTLLSLEEGFPPAERLPIAQLASLSLDEYLTQRSPNRDVVLVLDQFEEVLNTASTDREGKQLFFNQLGDALRNKNRWALFSMREDYLGSISPYLRPIPDRLGTRFRLDLLGAEAAIQAMQMPAKVAGINFSEAAAQKLADDLRRIQVQQPDGSVETELGLYVEPVQLQVVCYRLMENLPPGKKEITEQDLASVGDVNQSLANYYAQSVGKASGKNTAFERQIREWFDRKLITPEGLRSQVRMGTENTEGLTNQVVRDVENAHIIRTEQRAGQTWVELAHDRLVRPVRTNNRQWFSDNLTLFQRQAELWLQKGRTDGLLLSGKELVQAESEVDNLKLTDDETLFLNACRQLKKRERRERILRRGIAAGLVASIILFFVAVYFGYSATKANLNLANAANTAQAASTQAIFERANAQVASTQAIAQQSTAQAASTQAIAQQSVAQAASTRAISNAYAASTAMARAEIEKRRAVEQEAIAQEQKRQALASSIISQSLLEQLKLKDDLSNLLAAEAFKIQDMTRTRVRMLTTVFSRGRMNLAQSTSVGVVPNLGFISSDAFISSVYIGCEKDNIFMCDSGLIRFWDIRRDTRPGSNLPVGMRQDPASIDPPGQLDAMAVSPDGVMLATASCAPLNAKPKECGSENIQFWDVKTRANANTQLRFEGSIANEKKVLLQYSPDGKTLAMAINISTIFNSAASPQPVIVFWDTLTLKQTGLVTPPNGLAQMVFSPDGQTLALASGRGVTFVDMASKQLTDLPQPTSLRTVLSLAYSPDGKSLALGMDDNRIQLVDAASGQLSEPAMANQSKPLALAFSPDGKLLAAGYQDSGVILWDVPSQQRLIAQVMYKHSEVRDAYPIYGLSFSPDGKQLATISNEIILWDTDPASWLTKSCGLAGRNFSKAEWQLYFPDEEYRITCAQFPEGR